VLNLKLISRPIQRGLFPTMACVRRPQVVAHHATLVSWTVRRCM